MKILFNRGSDIRVVQIGEVYYMVNLKSRQYRASYLIDDEFLKWSYFHEVLKEKMMRT